MLCLLQRGFGCEMRTEINPPPIVLSRTASNAFAVITE